MKLLMDACSIILLGKASVLETAAETYTVAVTKEVDEEVMEGKKNMSQDALLLERLRNERKIVCCQASTTNTKKLVHDFNMGKGEASIISRGIEDEKLVITTDNRQGRKAARINGLSVVGSIEIIVDLFKKKKINKEKAQSALKILKEEGWFNQYLIENALEDVR